MLTTGVASHHALPHSSVPLFPAKSLMICSLLFKVGKKTPSGSENQLIRKRKIRSLRLACRFGSYSVMSLNGKNMGELVKRRAFFLFLQHETSLFFCFKNIGKTSRVQNTKQGLHREGKNPEANWTQSFHKQNVFLIPKRLFDLE